MQQKLQTLNEIKYILHKRAFTLAMFRFVSFHFCCINLYATKKSCYYYSLPRNIYFAYKITLTHNTSRSFKPCEKQKILHITDFKQCILWNQISNSGIIHPFSNHWLVSIFHFKSLACVYVS